MEFILKKNKVKEFLETLSKTCKIIAPVKEGELINFKPVDKFDNIILDYSKTVKSPKEFLFPQSEELCKYKYKGKELDLVPAEIKDEKSAIIGIHPCDAKAILIMDKLFNWDYKDELYFNRRKNTILISLTCNSPDWSCFCTSLEGKPYDAEGTDIHLSDIGEGYFLETKTEKGEQIVKETEKCLEKIKDEDKKKLDKLRDKIKKELPSKVNVNKVTENLENIFEHKIWDRISEKCIHCGACAYLCPTCHCFDIIDEGNYEDGKRIRCWDACMGQQFTRMAGGHNPRNKEKTRYRQRIFHKFNYYKKNFNIISCVGCGRCISECPTGMDLMTTLQAIETIERDK